MGGYMLTAFWSICQEKLTRTGVINYEKSCALVKNVMIKTEKKCFPEIILVLQAYRVIRYSF